MGKSLQQMEPIECFRYYPIDTCLPHVGLQFTKQRKFIGSLRIGLVGINQQRNCM
jgi:hypothetical protein